MGGTKYIGVGRNGAQTVKKNHRPPLINICRLLFFYPTILAILLR